MIIFVCEHRASIDLFNQGKYARLIGSQDCLFVCNSFSVKWKLEQVGLPFCHVDGAVPIEQAKRLDALGVDIAKTWYLQEGHDSTCFEGVSMGAVWEYDAIGLINNMLKYYAGLKNLISNTKPSLVLSDSEKESFRGTILGLVCEQIGYEFRFVSHQPSTGWKDWVLTPFVESYNADVFGEELPGGFAGHTHVRRLSKALFVRAFGWLSEFTLLVEDLVKKQRNEILVISSSQIKNLIERWCSSKQDSRLVLLGFAAPNRRLLARSFWKGARLISLGGRGIRRDQEDRIRTVKEKLIEYLACLPFAHRSDSIPLNELLRPLLGEFVREKIDVLARLVGELDDVFVRRSISLVVLPNDVVEVCKALVLVARKHGVRSLVIQHGYHGYRLDQDKRYADMLAVWGDLDKQQYVEEGVDPQRIFVTGSPNFDGYAQYSGQPDRDFKLIRRVLILTTNLPGMSSAVDFCVYETFVPTIVKVLRQHFDNLEIIVKIHPSESVKVYKRMLKELVGVKLEQDVDLLPLIMWSDLVIAAVTTAVFDCVVLGKPAVCAALGKGRWDLPAPLDGVSGIPMAYNPRELAELLDRLVSHRRNQLDFDHPRLRSFLGLVDGKAIERVQALIVETVRNSRGQ